MRQHGEKRTWKQNLSILVPKVYVFAEIVCDKPPIQQT